MKKINKQHVKQNIIIRQADQDNRSIDSKKPVFSLEYLHKDYCISNLEKNEKVGLITKLHHISKHTWNELKLKSIESGGCKPEPIGIMKAPIPDKFVDISYLYAFIFHERKRMVCAKDNDGICYILFLDRNFTLYDHGS